MVRGGLQIYIGEVGVIVIVEFSHTMRLLVALLDARYMRRLRVQGERSPSPELTRPHDIHNRDALMAEFSCYFGGIPP